tara:strand:- start:510 stop:698 length:189 start_codon:yes stop_codon:yes gene_type:complete
MPEYQIQIKSKVKGVNAIKKRIIASSHSDAEKEIKRNLSKDQYIHSLDNISFSKDKITVIER